VSNWVIRQAVDLSRGVEAASVWPNALMLAGDHMAHTWRVSVTDKGVPVPIADNVSGLFERADGNTVYLQGKAAGNVAEVTLTQQCYAIPGELRALMRVGDTDGRVLSLILTIFRVGPGPSDQIVDPGDVIPSLDELLALIGKMEEALLAAMEATMDAQAATDSANNAAADATHATQDALAAVGLATDAADQANAISAKLSNLGVEVEMLPPDGEAGGSVSQTDDSTTFHFSLPQGRVTNARLYVDDETTELMQRMPLIPEVGIDYVMDKETTELFMRVHGY